MSERVRPGTVLDHCKLPVDSTRHTDQMEFASAECSLRSGQVQGQEPPGFVFKHTFGSRVDLLASDPGGWTGSHTGPALTLDRLSHWTGPHTGPDL